MPTVFGRRMVVVSGDPSAANKLGAPTKPAAPESARPAMSWRRVCIIVIGILPFV
jgi:hypothetical protein